MIAILSADLPALVVCPASVMVNWRREIEMWRPEAASKFRIMSYASPRFVSIRARDYGTVILDECHYVKNPEAKRSRLACGLLRYIGRRGKAFALSGTPIPNRPIELWPLLYSMRITDLSYVDFAFRYASAFENQWHELDVRGASNLSELRALLAPSMIRFTKEQVLPELPPKTWRVLALNLPPDTREKEWSRVDVKRMDPGVAFEAMSDVLHLHGIRKVPLVAEHVKNLLASVHKVLLFAHHRDVIAALAGELRAFHPVTVLGGQTSARKQAAVDHFQDPKSKTRLFIGQVEAAGVGLNLTAASHVVFAEASWVPSTLEQAADRAHRIGTKGNVTVDLLTIHRSIDEHMLRRALEKLDVVNQVVSETPFASDSESDRILYQ